MDLEKLKEGYKDSNLEELKSAYDLNKMKLSGNHPVLNGIKRQLIVESIIWTLLLIVFYDFFDGHIKPLYWTAILAMSIILLLVHNILGFIIVQRPISNNTIKMSLKKYLATIKRYAIVSIASRIITITIFIVYLTSNIEWNVSKIWSTIGFFTILIIVQLVGLGKIWRKRIRIISNQVDNLEK